MSQKQLHYTRLYTLPNGDSAFASEVMPLDQHPTTDLAAISATRKLDYASFLSFVAHAVFDLHTAPCRQFIFHLKGAIEIEVSNGEKRLFSAGDVVFVEDVTGKGHITRVLNDDDAMIAVCPVA